MLIAEMTKLLKNEIPMSDYMDFRLLEATNEKVIIQIPLLPNRNHKGTAFGGSQYSACALACYGLLLGSLVQTALDTQDIVISDGNIDYKKAVTKDFTIHAHWESLIKRDLFFQTLKNKKRARVTLLADILVDNQVCGHFKGRFVAAM